MTRVSAGSGRISQYSSFWPFYLREHSRKATRRLHYIGSTLSLLCLLAGLLTQRHLLFLFVGLVFGYGPAWVGHFFVERNRPATFKYPGWSFFSDYRMYALWLTGKLDPHLKAAHVPLDR